jgi:hypothetical protein
MSDRVGDLLESARIVRKSTGGNLAAYKTGASTRKYGFEISDEQADALFRSACHYCGYQPFQRFNGIDRVDNKLGYVAGNVVACCAWCNRAKGRFPVESFFRWLRWVQSGASPESQPDDSIESSSIGWGGPPVPPPDRKPYLLDPAPADAHLDLSGLTPKEYVRRKVWNIADAEQALPHKPVARERKANKPKPIPKPKPIRILRAHDFNGQGIPKASAHFQATIARTGERRFIPKTRPS